MTLDFDLSPAARVAEAIAGRTTATDWLLEAGSIAIALGTGWFIARALRGRVEANPRWKFGKGGFERLAFPLLALAFAWVGRNLLEGRYDTAVLDIVVSLLVAYTGIRLAVYVLGHVIPEGGLQQAVIRAAYWIAWILVALHLSGLLPEVLHALDSHGFEVGKGHDVVTLLDIAKGVVALFLGVTLALWVSRVTESRVLAAESIEMTTRVVISKSVRILALLVGLFIALPLAGIDVTTLSIFSGALGVGLGFGLQKVAANYVSGFIVLLDRSLRIGDVVTVDNRRGEVKAIESRFTVIKGADGVESIIPNEKMITEIVSHHTYSDPRISMVVAVTVSYESDIERACAILAEAAQRQPRVIAEPAAAARVKQLTERGVELELTVWIDDPVVGEGELRSDLLKDVLKAYRSAAIEIPYPHREVRLRATPETGIPPAHSGS
jgi:small-conductance mechanosensitive channel